MKTAKIELSEVYLSKYQQRFEKLYEKTVFERQESGFIHNSVEWGNLVYESLKKHDIPQLIRAMQSVYDNFTPGKLSEDGLRSSKNLIICLVATLANRSSSERIVDNELVLTASDVCIMMCEKTSDRDELLKCAYAGLIKLSDLMKEYRERDYHPLAKAAKEYIYQHLHDELRVKDIAAALSVSPEHLSRCFHKAEGLSLKKYILEERMERARNLLRLSDYTVSEISRYLAFSSQSHFSEIFRQQTGKTPLEYRRDFVTPK